MRNKGMGEPIHLRRPRRPRLISRPHLLLRKEGRDVIGEGFEEAGCAECISVIYIVGQTCSVAMTKF